MLNIYAEEGDIRRLVTVLRDRRELLRVGDV
jgi:hypothetical protein